MFERVRAMFHNLQTLGTNVAGADNTSLVKGATWRAKDFVILDVAPEKFQTLRADVIASRANAAAKLEEGNPAAFAAAFKSYVDTENEVAWRYQTSPEMMRYKRDVLCMDHPTAFSPPSVTREKFVEHSLPLNYDMNQKWLSVRGDISRLGPQLLAQVLDDLKVTKPH